MCSKPSQYYESLRLTIFIYMWQYFVEILCQAYVSFIVLWYQSNECEQLMFYTYKKQINIINIININIIKQLEQDIWLFTLHLCDVFTYILIHSTSLCTCICSYFEFDWIQPLIAKLKLYVHSSFFTFTHTPKCSYISWSIWWYNATWNLNDLLICDCTCMANILRTNHWFLIFNLKLV